MPAAGQPPDGVPHGEEPFVYVTFGTVAASLGLWPAAYASVLVTHGGYGTVLGGLRAGVPLVATPLFADQRENAVRVAAVGAGAHVEMSAEPMDLSPGWGAAIRVTVLDLLAGDHERAAAQRLSRDMAAHPPAESMVEVVTAAARA